MPDRWFIEYHKGDAQHILSWWEVKTDDQNYFIVENVGDPNDGARLASMLNERERLLIDKIDMQTALREASEILENCDDMGHDLELKALFKRIDELLAR